ncbi:reverse transcriptase family protein [Rivihabitans pingtungensis]|uniref:reverse transcriptase family protein n=1 Tax=Rivihabitans pingtungensis TaxID=1054498 RepID=UPI00235779E2|nr:reverse transcriptase family protein [Rivihabitans pingtungensis]MCK6436608.1 reverse transcriptase family protein [Rivihabitans pingtungensis]
MATLQNFDFAYNSWIEYARKNQLDFDVEKFKRLTEKLESKKLPIIIGSASLALFLGVSERQLESVLGARHKFYRQFEIPKRSGGVRSIACPYPFLYNMQKTILLRILNPYCSAAIEGNAHGFLQGRSIKSNAQAHAANHKKQLLKLDISDFFGSVKQMAVQEIFREMGYGDKIARVLGRLCCHQGYLPQGAPTSPALSNLAFTGYDQKINAVCTDLGLIYTRYADDMSISGDDVRVMVDNIEAILIEGVFRLNHKKTKVYNSGFSITGVSISEGELRLPKKVKRQYRQDIYFIRKYGILASMNRQAENKFRYPEVVLGRLQHWLNIEGISEELEEAFDVYWRSINAYGLTG